MAKKLLIDKKIMIIYMITFGILMLIYCSVNTPSPVGEWDDYSLPIASILNDHNFSISDEDVLYYKGLFPNWADNIDNYDLSGYTTRDGSGQMPWYFPTYAIVCIPLTLILGWLKLPTIFAFPYTNLAFLMISVSVMYKNLKCDETKKSFMVLLLTLNPIVFYIGWISAEVFIYSMLIIGLTAWYNRWYRRAAFFVSAAGMLNTTIMSVGIVMIVEYTLILLKTKSKAQKWSLFLKDGVPDIIKYGCCYMIGVIPMIYNYYNVGHINLTASLSGFTNGTESTISRFLAYFYDLNFGFLPYFSIILILAIILILFAIAKKNFRYIEWILTFIINVVLYSIMVHINCGMSGISRYNSWGISILIFAVVLIGLDFIVNKTILKVGYTAIEVGIVLTTIIVFSYGPNKASNTSYVKFTPIAKWVLDNIPGIYNPLKSTFNSRTTHVDGGYGFETPVVYYAEDGYVRKILASEKDKEELMNNYTSFTDFKKDFNKQISCLSGIDLCYISVPAKAKLTKAANYNIGTNLRFSTNESNGMIYIYSGVNISEDWGTWSEGNKVIMRMKTSSSASILHATIKAGVYNNVQNVIINVNDKEVYNNPKYTGDGIEFDFGNPGEGNLVEFTFDLPEAISPVAFGYEDGRILGIGFTQMVITEVTISE